MRLLVYKSRPFSNRLDPVDSLVEKAPVVSFNMFATTETDPCSLNFKGKIPYALAFYQGFGGVCWTVGKKG